MTKSHNDRVNVDNTDYGYSVRVGKTLPANSANLAYVHSEEVLPKTNLLITDLSSKIVDNTINASTSTETLVYPDDTFLLRELGKPYTSPTSNVVLTDEFSIPSTTQEAPAPLYYKAEAKGYFDLRGGDLVYWPGGYTERPITEILTYGQVDSDRVFLYLGKKIHITKLDGTPIDTRCKFKIKLEPYSGEGIPAHMFKVIIYTNFRGTDKETYVLRYERYNMDGSHSPDSVEILNAYPFFSKVNKDVLDELAENTKENDIWRPELNEKSFAVNEREDKQWEVYAPSQVIIADNVTRPSHQFEYRIRGKLRTKLSTSDRGSINIGLIYFNENIYGAEDLRDVVKKVFESTYRPQYLDFVNPHPAQADLPKENAMYWNIDLTMPADYLNDYDLIIITGYGTTDTSMFNDAFRNYLENGGVLWIDNAGTNTEVLTLNNFLTNIGFSSTTQSTGNKLGGASTNADTYSLEVQALNRLYVVNKSTMSLGYTGVNPKITFGAGESASLWRSIVKYSTNDPAVISRSIFGNGTIVVSNCGLFRSLANKTTDDIKIAFNMILAIAEQKWVNTPWLNEYVYHRDNLFKEEYIDGSHDIYIDDRNDNDSTQIVAKKIIAPSVRDALIPYMPSSYYKAKGTFFVETKADSEIAITNSDFEVGTYDTENSVAVTTWTQNENNAIPGWNIALHSGSALFEHVSNVSQRGTKAIKVSTSTTSTAHWYNNIGRLSQGSYQVSAWVKTDASAGGGTRISVRSNGTIIAESNPLLGTVDWTKVELNFALSSATNVEIHMGFEVGTGALWIDQVALVEVGSVFMTPANDGSRALYAYAVRPRGDVFDLKTEGFTNADVTTYDPEIKINYTIKSFVYAWDNTLTQYIRKYGNSKSYTAKIRRSDGMMSLGLLTTALPALQGGPEWADKGKVFFEIEVGGVELYDTSSELVNVGFFNTRGGHYFYSKTGENVIGYTELFDGNQTEGYVIIQAWTNYYTIRATKRRFSLRVQDDQRIYLEYPATIDNRDAWSLRIHNGSFTKRGLQYDEYAEFISAYSNKQFGAYSYSIPEYQNQFFSPGQPYRRVRKEICEYVDDSTIKVQRAPLYVERGESRRETLSDVDGLKTMYRATHGNWIKSSVKVYADTNNNGVFNEISGGFRVDYTNGILVFTSPANGTIKVDYDYENLQVFKRRYTNAKVKKEPLQISSKTLDHRTFVSDHRSWLMYPSPTIYVLPDGGSDYEILSVDTYKIDYDAGSVEFKSDMYNRIFVDYNYSIDTQLKIRDYDIQSGLIYLQDVISFKDELYANYYYEENFYEYRGYYDQELQKFVQLDLNPTEGHYCTMPVYRIDPATNNAVITRYDSVPTAKLMNKEVYIYLLPRSGSYNVDNDYTVRHCYSEAEWLKIRKTLPGIAILLGVIQLREHTSVKDVVVMDTRVRGGGLKKNFNREAIKKRSTSSLSYWDMGPWDGTAYYSNGVVILNLPNSILKVNGGQFEEQQVIDILKKYVAYGVYYVIEYTDPVTAIDPEKTEDFLDGDHKLDGTINMGG